MPKTVIKIGPEDHGRRMRLEEFDHAEGQEGYLYELSRGIITVMDVPRLRHLAQVNAIRLQFTAYMLAYPGRIYALASGNECKILVTDLESERHPDLALYKTSHADTEDIWSTWIPELVIEVISRSSKHRDYEEKPEEYFRFGVTEYWILDADRQEMLVLRRSRGRWVERTIRPPQVYRTRLLPGFEFSCAVVFQAADAAGS
jgi:Uma2 family endonuclease